MSHENSKSSTVRFSSMTMKMSLIMAAVLFFSMLGTVGFFLTDNLRHSVNTERERLNTLSSVYRAVLSNAVANNDKASTREVLRSLRDIPTLKHAAVLNNNADLLAEMGSGAVLERKVLDTGTFGLLDLLSKDTLRITNPITNGGANVGSLQMIADISWLVTQFWKHATLAFITAISALLAAFVIGNQLIRRASRRLTNLATALADIGEEETLTVKFKRETNDEVGILVDAFNDMIDRIDVRDKALRAHNENLEDTIAERTSELVLARDEAENANNAKSEFLSMMSHEIRTPMNGMMVMAQMLAAAPLSPRHLRFAEIINRSGQNLLSIINDVLDISKIEAGKLIIEANPFSIDDILADTHGLFYERAREKAVSITYRVDASVPAILIGDETRLNQVITNLVNNALKFTETGGVTIYASTRQGDNGLLLQIRVEDTGIGIADDKLGLVFERFAQADQSITRRFGGTGLGLAISRRLVEAMGGNISVSSSEGLGSTFLFEVSVEAEDTKINMAHFNGTKIKLSINDTIETAALTHSLLDFGASIFQSGVDEDYDLLLSENTMDVEQASVPALLVEPALDMSESHHGNRGRLVFAIPTSRKQIRDLANAVQSNDYTRLRIKTRIVEQERSYTQFRGLRALAVDDNIVNREVLIEALHAMDIVVDAAVNGEDALQRMNENHYDIVFMDCSMPIMDGYTATRHWRLIEANMVRRLPIVAITALSEHGGQDSWQNAGMDGWLSKPFTIPAIAERISALVLKHEMNVIDISQLSHDQKLDNRYENIALLDEQTVSMIARIGGQGAGSASMNIYDLFVSNAQTAMDQLKSAFDARGHDQIASCTHSLMSVSESVGAARLSALARELEEVAKSRNDVSPYYLEKMQIVFEHSKADLTARFEARRRASLG